MATKAWKTETMATKTTRKNGRIHEGARDEKQKPGEEEREEGVGMF